MSVRLIRTLAVASTAFVAAACSEQVPTASLSDDVVASVAELDRQAARAGGAGDSASAGAFRGAAEALRHGVRPTEIEVFVGGEMMRYNAVVAAEVARLAEGDSALRRTLIAWNGGDRPNALLHVTTLADHGSFGSPDEPASDPRSRAHGVWVNLVRESRWLATVGDASLGVNSTGENCLAPATAPASAPPRPAAAARCVKAEFRIAVDGLFRANGAGPDAGLPAVRIQTEAASVNGYIVGAGRGGAGGPARPGRG